MDGRLRGFGADRPIGERRGLEARADVDKGSGNRSAVVGTVAREAKRAAVPRRWVGHLARREATHGYGFDGEAQVSEIAAHVDGQVGPIEEGSRLDLVGATIFMKRPSMCCT